MKTLSSLAAIGLTAVALWGCDPQDLNRTAASDTTAPPANTSTSTDANTTTPSGPERVLDVQVRLNRTASVDSRGRAIGKAQLDPVTATRAKFHARTEVTSANQMVAIGYTAEGDEVYRQVTRDPLELEAEVFDPATGAISDQEAVEKATSLLRLKVPERLRVTRLALYRVSRGAEGFELTHYQDVPLVLAPESEQPARSAMRASNNGVFSMLHNGDSANRVDLVVVSEGYTQDDLAHFEQDVRTIIDGYFDADVYANYKPVFNVWRVEVPSNQSGAGQGAPIDTRFGAHFGCYNIQRLLCVDENEVLDYLRGVLPANAIDKVLVVVNTDTYGGAGGQVATMSLAPQAINLALHELGHSFAHLADEYDYGTCNRNEPNEANVTTDPNGTKWSQWFNRATNVGVYEGGRYCQNGMYRPTFTSMMKVLGEPFYAVNESQIVRSIYEYVDVMDATAPTATDIALTTDDHQTFSVTPVDNIAHSTAVTWTLDGQTVARGPSYTFEGSAHGAGTYRLSAQAADTTDRVINDPDGLLRSTKTWTITLTGSGSSCKAAPTRPGALTADLRSDQVRFSWPASSGADTYYLQQWSGQSWTNRASTEDTGLSLPLGDAGDTDYFRVFAENDCGTSAATDWISVQYPTCTAVPASATGLQAQQIQSTNYMLTWWPVDGADSYRVEIWNGYDRTWDTLLTTANSWSRIDNLRGGTVQYVRVVASNACGEGDATPYIRVQTPY